MDLSEDARTIADELIDLRHRLHRHPEVGLHLPVTQAAVLQALDGLDLEISTGTGCTSVTAVLRGGTEPSAGPGAGAGSHPSPGPVTAPSSHPSPGPAAARPVVLLRGDMDALPVREEVDVPFRSELDGLMHACGHDLHTAILVGAARLLHAHRESLAGDVVFMFQPGEEGYDGAGLMISEGVLDAAGRRADAAFALHVMSNLTARGIVASRSGPLMAASDGAFVTVRGRGGHGSSPHLARDPVPAACAMVLNLHTVLARTIDTFAPQVFTVGTLHAGTRRNIIPDTVSFEATVRTFDPAVRALIERTVHQVCEGTAAAYGVQAEVRYEEEYPVTVNDAVEARFALEVADELFGAGTAVTMPHPIGGSEDFSRVLARVPGAMVFLGALVDDGDPLAAPSNHSPLAAFADDTIPDGAALLATLALRRLATLAGGS